MQIKKQLLSDSMLIWMHEPVILNETEKVTVETFTIIYKLTEWLHQIGRERKPRKRLRKWSGTVKSIEIFQLTKKHSCWLVHA
jgi:translation initiation factor IF-2